ncbi:hypothetical protein BCR34DRAFT_586830 [Clohesyomyces aquaticus]|uniref:Uncharacterized protein n=1 Tax=Clohesyomyces aquaticus TaxID=1231657 RepID=A0A1Y1ZRN8_9PLEO|nr:hypothetical protein BCR34DRAFT_586830 [Clohesyomyces aquaticus]
MFDGAGRENARNGVFVEESSWSEAPGGPPHSHANGANSGKSCARAPSSDGSQSFKQASGPGRGAAEDAWLEFGAAWRSSRGHRNWSADGSRRHRLCCSGSLARPAMPGDEMQRWWMN